MRRVKRALVERVQDPKVKFSGKTALNVWSTLGAACDAASDPDHPTLCCRTDRPDAGMKGPAKSAPKRQPHGYPNEVVQFARCADVPLWWRRWFVLNCYLACRPGELAALRWAQVDLERRVIVLDRAWDHRADDGRAKSTKTGKSRQVAIDPAVVPLLLAMRAEEPDAEHVIAERERIDLDHMASALRRLLLIAGVDRPALHESDNMNDPAGLYTARHTGLTWEAVRSGSAFAVRDLAGHASITMSQAYVDNTSAYRRNPEAFGTPFPPLPRCLLGEDLEADSRALITPLITGAQVRVILCEGGDLNPHNLTVTGT